MATLALAAVGAAAGSALLPAGISVLGATLTGAAIGSQLGALAGSYIDNALFGPSGQSRAVDGPRLTNLHITASTEGAPIPRIYGRARLGGQVIWATDFEEEVITSSQSAGGGKGGSFGGGASVSSTEYRYYANFAVALCEGPVTRIGRVWADGRELDLTGIAWRLHKGTETDAVDSLIAAREGAGNAPAFRGTAYIVFQRLALADFGNRIPQLSFEVQRTIDDSDASIRGLVLIPGSGEFVYSTVPVRQVLGVGFEVGLNVHSRQGPTDWDVAIDQLQASLPNAKSISFVVSWFGTDLRAGNCKLYPGVEILGKATQPISWGVAGVGRNDAYLVSTIDGFAAYGGTPSDQTVIGAIRDLTHRGLRVTMTPFILMDVPAGNALPNPYGGSGQPAYPWRGRITCYPAAGQAGTVDKTATAATQIASFVGTAAPAHFSLVGDTVVYSGPNEWSYRRMILHQAFLAKAAGGIEAFQIGSELRGLTGVRSNASTFPFVAALMSLAADVKSVLGPTVKVFYTADWSEYFGYQPGDGTGDVYFHLDPLFASPSIDAIGMDVYWPLADWRDGRAHLDYQAGYRSGHDLNYLKANVQGGEGYDWYYTSTANRDAQIRTPITDGAGKPWVYRYKDIKSWWLNAHYNRPGGVESTTATAWVPQSKPFWFMEIGCPAVDKGANQPNLFVDPKSAENGLPYYSTGVRDDLMQRRFLQAFRDAFDWTKIGYVAGLNPVSSVTSQRMVNLDHIHVYCWDARPFPEFPSDTETWGDGPNWSRGHWLNGRLSSAPLNEAVSRILKDYGFTDYLATSLNGTVPGYVIDRVMSARDALQPLELAYFFDSVESGGKITFKHRGQEGTAASYATGDLVEVRAGDPLITLTRGQETELPASAKLRFLSEEDDYQQAVAEARRLTGASGRVAQADLPIVLDDGLSGAMAETWLYETWAARERASFALPPSSLALEPGDVVAMTSGGRTRTLRVTDVSEHGVREIEARSIDPDVYGRIVAPGRTPQPKPPVQVGSPGIAFLDLPLPGSSLAPETGYVAAVQVPWPGSVAVYYSPQTSGYQLKALVPAPAAMGATLDALLLGPEGRIDWRAKVRVKLVQGTLTSADMVTMLGGVNTAAIKNASGDWEVIQFLNAVLVDVQTYELSGLLRGQGGTESAMQASVAAGATFVLLDSAVTQVPLVHADANVTYNWRYGPGNRSIGDASYVTVPFAFKGLGLRPYSPTQVKGARAGGDLTVSWLRRTRIGGDNWDVAEVPLSEDSESYDVEIYSGATLKRTLSSSATAVTYTAAQQVADFGTAQAAVPVKVYQKSALYGRGTARAAVV
jgi:GTA TIM-barrel-like domain/Putative phage tail protein